MMGKSVAVNYAEALTNVAREVKLQEEVRNDLNTFAAGYEASRELRRFVHSPRISMEEKKQVMEKIGRELSFRELSVSMLCLMVERKRMSELPRIMRIYGAIIDREMGRKTARVISARTLNEKEEEQLRNVLEERTGMKIRLNVKQDEGLLAGIEVRIGDTLYEGSVRRELHKLQKKMMEGPA